MEHYLPTEVAKLLHMLPHISFNFTYLKNPAFTLDNESYLQSLAIVALMPVVLLLITMIGFLFYFCCIGIKESVPNKNNSSSCYCSVCLMITSIMLALGGIGIASYGSIQCQHGLHSASSATMDINQSFSTITVKVHELSDLVDGIIEQANMLLNNNPHTTKATKYVNIVGMLNNSLKDLPEQTEGANDRLEWIVYFFKEFELYRRIFTFSLIGLLSMVCLFGMAGVCFHSKCLLVITTFLGLVCLVASYLLIGANLMSGVATSDFCMDPYGYIHSQAVGKLYMSNTTAQYYLQCSQELGAKDPYAHLMTNFERYVNKALTLLKDLEQELPSDEMLIDNIAINTKELSTLISILSKELKCKQVHSSLKMFVDSFCTSAVEGLFLLIVSLIFTSFALTAVLCASPKTWKRFSKHTASHDSDLDLDDVFLPTTNQPQVISRINNPLYVSHNQRGSGRISSNISSTNLPVTSNALSFFRQSEENITLLEQPPPYSPPHPISRFNED